MRRRNGTVWFVVGTGTDVGKTVATASLLRAALAAGIRVQAVKAVQTGCQRKSDGSLSAPDVAAYAKVCPGTDCHWAAAFTAPCSPHLAAHMEEKTITAADISKPISDWSLTEELTIVEGAGGLLVPLNDTETLADVVSCLADETILVAPNVLGTVNHCLLTAEALATRGIRLSAIVFTSPQSPAQDELSEKIREDNIETIRKRTGVGCIVELPFYHELAAKTFSEKNPAWNAASVQMQLLVEHLMHEKKADRKGDTDTTSTIEFDKKHLWHPYAPTVSSPAVWSAEKTVGCRIELAGGRTLVDGMSSWWAAIHGYNHPRLLAALQRQAAKMPHIMFGGFTHRPAVELGRRLIELAPESMDRVFFCDSGSVAVEAALKMAVQYQQAAGQEIKNRMATPLGGYHGDTVGAMSVCDPIAGMHRLFTGMLASQVFFDKPVCRFGEPFNPKSLASLEAAFDEHGTELAAVIIEPIVQGAGGMWFYHAEYLRRLRELCDAHGVLLILDEIATGFGRTGKMFACEWADVKPDILCIGKALTGGTMTLAAVMTTDRIAQTISRNGVFMHGPTFMANPLACAVAGASVELLLDTPWAERVAFVESELRQGLAPCREMRGVADVRVLGAIGVVEMESSVNVERLQRFFVDECGVWIRPFARLIYVMPPYIAGKKDLAMLTTAIRKAVEEEKWK